MHLGRCCQCSDPVRPQTIKCLSITDGSTLWEYGIGGWWRHHYGMDQITGLVVPSSVTFDTYVIQLSHGQTIGFPNRATTSLAANCKECVSIVSLDATDGSVNHNSSVSGLFCWDTAPGSSFRVATINDAVTITGACGLSGGNYVTVGKRLPQIELTDYGSNNATKTYKFHGHTQQAGSITLTTRTSGDSIAWAYNASNATIKTAIETSGDVVSATVTGGTWPYTAVSISVVWNGTSDDFATVTFTETTGSEARPTFGACTTYTPSSGAIANSVGCVFGDYSSAAKLVSVFGVIPSLPDAIEPCADIRAGASDTVIVSQYASNGPVSGWFEGWTTGGTWSENYTIQNNVPGARFSTTHSSDGGIIISGKYTTFSGPKNRIGGRVDISAGTITEIDHTNSVIDGEPVNCLNLDGSATPYVFSNLNYIYTQSPDYAVVFNAHFNGYETDANGTLLLLGNRKAFGLDANNIYGLSTVNTPDINYDFPSPTPSTISGTSAKGYYWKFFTEIFTHMDTGTEWRLRFASSTLGVRTTAWLDWHCTAAQIKTAIDAIFTANTEGVTDNVTINPFGTPAALTNTTSLLERGLEILFAGANVLDYIPTQFLVAGRITIQIQSDTPVNTAAGVGAWQRSNGAEVWSRAYGTIGAASVNNLADAWLRNGYVYCTGLPVDNDLP